MLKVLAYSLQAMIQVSFGLTGFPVCPKFQTFTLLKLVNFIVLYVPPIKYGGTDTVLLQGIRHSTGLEGAHRKEPTCFAVHFWKSKKFSLSMGCEPLHALTLQALPHR